MRALLDRLPACLVSLLTAFTAAQTPVDSCGLQFPASQSIAYGSSTGTIYGRVFKAGVTEPAGPAAGIVGELGYGPLGSDPATSNAWQWFPTNYNLQIQNEDEYEATIPTPLPGTHHYAYRFRYQNTAWVYGDLDGSANGYSPAQAGVLTVSGTATPVDWCNLLFPSSAIVPAGTTLPTTFARVYKAGVTDVHSGPAPGIAAWFGYGPDGSNPASPAWAWFPATFSFSIGNDDEYAATVAAPMPGVYDYAFRFAYANSAFVYGDLDGSTNGYSPAQAGALQSLGQPNSQPSNCGGPVPLAIAVTGYAGIGGAVTSAVSGFSGGVPFYTWDVLPPQPLLLPCPCLVLANGWAFGTGSTIVIPFAPGLIGLPLRAQGVEVLPLAGACPVPVALSFTDVVLVTVF